VSDKHAVIAAHRTEFPIRLMCRVLTVTPSGYYAAQRRGPSARAVADGALRVVVRATFRACRQHYGAPRLMHELRAAGTRVSTKRVARLLRAERLVARRRRRFVRPPRETPEATVPAIAPNLLARRFAVTNAAPLDTVWVGDMTYIPTREGYLYLAVVLDLASRRVVGWAMRETRADEIVVAAFAMAHAQRRPAPGLVHHSDRGSQYGGRAFRTQLAAHGAVCSMSRTGNCWDNAVAESFFATLEHELIDDTPLPSRAAARTAIFEFIEVWYNRTRRHSTLGYVSPAEYEAARRSA
jgi:putative transposase